MTTQATAKQPAETAPMAGSQTLDRGLRALEILADSGGPITITTLAAELGVHRSSAYRILRTLEDHRFALRDEAGRIRLGPKLAALGRGVAPAFTQVAHPELTQLANQFGMTTFIALLDDDEVITILSIEPNHGHANVAQRPGARHPLTHGAPSHAVEASLTPEEHKTIFGGAPLSEAALLAQTQGYSISQDEIIRGVTAVAVPLRVHNEAPAALSIVTIGVPEPLAEIVSELRQPLAELQTTPGNPNTS